MATDSVIKFIVEGVVDRSMQLKFSSKEAQTRWAKGQAMQSLYGRAHGSKVAKVIEEALS